MVENWLDVGKSSSSLQNHATLVVQIAQNYRDRAYSQLFSGRVFGSSRADESYLRGDRELEGLKCSVVHLNVLLAWN